MSETSEFRATAIVADILKIIPTLAFGEIVGIITYIGERPNISIRKWFYIAVGALVLSGILSIVGLSAFVGPLAAGRNPIHYRGVRLCTVWAFYSLVAGSLVSAFVVIASQ